MPFKMILFYAEKVDGDLAYFSPEESQHLTKVLRKQDGQLVHFVDGKGGRYQGQIIESSKKGASLKILERQQEPINPFSIHLVIAPTKNINRFEWFLEKATEIGISAITPILTSRSERKTLRKDRLEKILLAAMKQSLKSYLPILHPLVDFKRFFDQEYLSNPNLDKYIAYLQQDVKTHLKDNYQGENSVIILIGPEGGFSSTEAEFAIKNGFKAVVLGPHRLRTETAGIVATHIVNLLNEKQ